MIPRTPSPTKIRKAQKIEGLVHMIFNLRQCAITFLRKMADDLDSNKTPPPTAPIATDNVTLTLTREQARRVVMLCNDDIVDLMNQREAEGEDIQPATMEAAYPHITLLMRRLMEQVYPPLTIPERKQPKPVNDHDTNEDEYAAQLKQLEQERAEFLSILVETCSRFGVKMELDESLFTENDEYPSFHGQQNSSGRGWYVNVATIRDLIGEI